MRAAPVERMTRVYYWRACEMDARLFVLLLMWMMLFRGGTTTALHLIPSPLERQPSPAPAPPPPPPPAAPPAPSTVLLNFDASASPVNPNFVVLSNRAFTFQLTYSNKSGLALCAAAVVHNLTGVQVWVANYNNVTSPEVAANQATTQSQVCALDFQGDGNLVLKQGAVQLWSSNTSNVGVARMELNVTGNLMLLPDGGNSNPDPLWQSFAHPTDMIITGQKLAANSSMDSAGGVFSLRVDTHLELVTNSVQDTARHDVVYWTHNSDAISYVVVQDGALQAYNASNTLIYTLPPIVSNIASDPTHLVYAQVQANGNLRVVEVENNSSLTPKFEALLWCEIPGICGPYGICSNRSGDVKCSGCAPGFDLDTTQECRAKTDMSLTNLDCFSDFDTVTLTGHTYFVGDDNTLLRVEDYTADDCKTMCEQNCTCRAAIHVRVLPGSNTGSCFQATAVESISDMPGNQTIYLKVARGTATAPGSSPGGPGAPAAGTKSQVSRSAAVAFAGVAGGGVCVLLGLSAWFLYVSRKKLFDAADKGMLESEAQPKLPPQFSYKELVDITSNFTQKLGPGGFSCVYAGLVPDKTRVAVKKLDDDEHGSKEFLAAAATVGSTSHENLVPLRGFCVEGEHRLLVYEFVHGGSLDRFLFNRRESTPLLDTHARRRIALGTARGLAHLHEDCRSCIIHADVKPENIVLDKRMHPRLVDFGFAYLMSKDQRLRVATMRGSRGYMAPEWLKPSPVTEKVDVYSFGVVLLELVSGRRCLKQGAPEESVFLPTWGFILLQQSGSSCVLELVDPLLGVASLTEAEHQVLKDMIFVALWCVQEEVSVRPTMKQVVKMLEGTQAVAAPPVSAPLFAFAKDLSSGYVGESAPESSNNTSRRTTFLSTQATSKTADSRPR